MAKSSSKNGKKVTAVQTKNSASQALLSDLEKVLELMGRHQVAELEYETSDNRLHLRTQAAFVAQAPVMMAPAALHAPAQAPMLHNGVGHAAPVAAAAPAAAAKGKELKSPFVGTFYRSPSPGAASYVTEGQSVKQGDVLCIIEAMKLMNEIEAEFSGKIVQILVENGQPVEFGEPLFLIDPA